ncbi:hypothetical protein GQ43DRAFT_456335 [Delitschia confertaspora ATCC 74209]|uniref:Mediator of RNA polymerase II transcription subunit 7 n=1 Tax=Delitschia confertaspora ATCC 74209 TaxID=1513339 RepID=A0A9P4JJM5_9PLEO|nr:hypothetical protein GQ43DRAFT_456335 [Delitschia confertaspora ATCC 74209]
MEDEEYFGGAFFPQPPPFYKYFTPSNLARLQQIQGGVDTDTSASSHPLSLSQILNLPPELRYLVPPEPPAEDEAYRVFGETRRLNQSPATLESWGYERLYPPPSSLTTSTWTRTRQQHLLTLTRSALLSFLELLGILAVNPAPEQWQEKMTDIAALVANAHSIINEYRPHQARETLIRQMERLVERKKSEVEGVRQVKLKIQEALNKFQSQGIDAGHDGGGEEVERGVEEGEKRREVQRWMWDVTEEVVGE